MKYAIIKSGSSQLKVSEGDKIRVLGHTEKPSFEVLFFSDGSKIFTDKSDLKSVKITSSVTATGRERKINVGRFKAKSRYDKTRGFRAEFTEVTISKITFGTEKEAKTETKEVAAEKEVKAPKVAKEKKAPVAKKEAAPKKTTVKKVKEEAKA
jgi:large subunit ribosomal protein L21